MNNDLISRSALAARIKQIPKDVCDGFQHVKFIEDCIQDAPRRERRAGEARNVDAARNRAIWASVLAMPFTGG